MHVLGASKGRFGWRVRLAKARVPDDEAPAPQDLESSRGMQVLMHSCNRLGIAAGPWQFEFPKSGLGRGTWAVGYAERLVEACSRDSATACAVTAPLALLSRRSAEVALEQRGLPVAGRFCRRSKDRARFVCAALAASAMVVADLLRHAHAHDTLPSESRELFALHGEWSNRTRLLLGQLGHARPPAAILVLGRPRRSLNSIGAQWREKLGQDLPPLLRPFSVGAAISAIPAIAGTLRVGLRLAPSTPYLPGMADMVGMAYRAILGEISAHWWNHQTVDVDRVWYGHTGLADTSGLELAQQARATETIHVVHGISGGLNFIARSSLGVFRCGHDAQWHAQLGGYGRCDADPAPLPGLARGERGFLLVSNLAHPMNPTVKVHGVRDEMALLEMAANAAAAHDPRAPLAWKPHPAIRSLPEGMTRPLFDRAKALGFALLPEHDDLEASARAAKYVLCSTSTVIVELLAEGVLPVMLAQRAPEPGSALSRYPVHAADAGSLAAVLTTLEDAQFRQAQFQQAWSAISPAMPFRIRPAAKIEG